MQPKRPALHGRVFALVMSILFLAAPFPAHANDQIMLTIDSPATEPMTFDLAALDALSQAVIETSNEFVTGTAEFSGPLARDLVTEAGGDEDSTILLTAINEYQISVPASDFFNYDVVLATRMNGTVLSRRDKGPIWLMYPISDHSELQDSSVNSKLIWQLVKMEVR